MFKLFLFSLFILSSVVYAQITLEKYNIDVNSISTSGVSAGGAMATQFHVAYSESVKGTAIFAGVIYHCANGLLATALTCMSTPGLTNPTNQIDKTNEYAGDGKIDPVSGLLNDKVFVWHGDEDTTVKTGNADNIDEYYRGFSADVNTIIFVGAEHCQPTDYYGNACDNNGPNYINNCNYPGAFEALNFIYDYSLAKVDETWVLDGVFSEFDQDEFFGLSGASAESVDDIGYIYVPGGCLSKSVLCYLHVVFHGCEQGRSFVDDDFAKNTGYLQVGERNLIIMLFPQAKTKALDNPNGCWDWWGYTGALKYATQEGSQMIALKKMVDRLVYGI